MSQKEAQPKSLEKPKIEVLRKDENGDFVIKDLESGNIITIEDTFAEKFPMVDTSPAKSPFF